MSDPGNEAKILLFPTYGQPPVENPAPPMDGEERGIRWPAIKQAVMAAGGRVLDLLPEPNPKPWEKPNTYS